MSDEVNSAQMVLELIEKNCDLDLEHTQVAEVAMSAALSVLSRLEAIDLSECLEMARRYWNQEATEEEQCLARKEAWSSIKGRTTDFSSPKVNLVRLLLCALYGRLKDLSTDQDGGLYTMVRFALDAGVEELELVNVLSSQFATELESGAH